MSVVLLGLSGSGKSSALNLIIDRAANQYALNESPPAPPQPTLSCERRKVMAAGGQLVLVDTPELWDEDGLEDVELVKDCLALSLPGPHVFLLVLQVGRFTQGESEMLGHLQKIFGKDSAERTIVLFVRFEGPNQGPQRISDYVAGAHESLQAVVQRCGSRFYELSITESQNALSYPQVRDLLSGINKLVAAYGGRPHPGRRFSVQELQERRQAMKERRAGALEGNSLLMDG